MAAVPTTDRRPSRSNAEWDQLAREVIVPRLQAGETMTSIRAEFGTGATIRRALMRIGYNTKGQKAEVAKTTGNKAQVLAKRVAARREAGASWDRLAMETGKNQDELKELLSKHGFASLAEGRVIISRRGKAQLAKAQAEAEAQAAKPKRVRKPRTRKAQPEPQPETEAVTQEA